MLSKQELDEILVKRHGKDAQKRFAASCVGIAGLGGLGSHIAVHLTRLGIGKLVLADFDLVDASNIHRQMYVLSDIGKPKTEALHAHLLQIHPYLSYTLHQTKITTENAASVFQGCDIVCEAFDRADQKAMLINTLLQDLPNTFIVSGNGMAGSASANLIQTTHPMRRLYLCGDGNSDLQDGLGLLSPRVGVCAAHQATMVMRLLLGKTNC